MEQVTLYGGHHREMQKKLKPQVDILLFAANANPLQICHSPRAKILAFKSFHITLQATAAEAIMSQRPGLKSLHSIKKPLDKEWPVMSNKQMIKPV